MKENIRNTSVKENTGNINPKENVRNNNVNQKEKPGNNNPKENNRNNNANANANARSPKKKDQKKLQIIPLGGLGEIGKNMTAICYGDDIVVIDTGMAFPDDELLGIDYVLNDISYLLENKDKVKAVLITHGHEDHIGGLSYFLKEINVPVFGTRLSLGLAEGRLKENKVGNYTLVPVNAGEEVKIGGLKVEFIRGGHSISDSVGLAIKTPIGTIVHTGDFKIDQTPVDGKLIDLHRFAALGDEGVLVLMSDSTNAERPGFTPSEKSVGIVLDRKIGEADGRVILATFASSIPRLQQAVDAAVKHNRKIAIQGRSMINVFGICQEMGYLNVPEGSLIDIDEINKLPAHRIMILTTGSQGEPLSALSRMAARDHRKVDIGPGDVVIISATPIPGNEKTVSKTIDSLMRLGAQVIYEKNEGIHVSGHASQEELKMMLNLVRPKYFIPVHGEYRMLRRHAELAEATGVEPKNILIGDNGNIFEFTPTSGAITGRVQAGRVFVDGLGVGDVGSVVLRDRKQLSQDGIIIAILAVSKKTGHVVSGPELVSRGFVYVRDSDAMMAEARKRIETALDSCIPQTSQDWGVIKTKVRDVMGKFLYEKTKRRPMILPIVMEVD